MPNPFINNRKSLPPSEDEINAPSNPLIPPNPNSIKGTTPSPNGYYKPISKEGTYSNYSQVYPSTTTNTPKPYYAKLGVGDVGTDKFMEKINYMVHMLEEQQMEKTNHITEEFILYSLLGVFMIYLVDGFSRTGKYVH